jgi:copper(I)-binding protein
VIAGANPRRGRRAGVAGSIASFAAAALLTAGCTAGQRAQTADEQETLDGTTVRAGQYITVGGLAFETPKDGTSWARGSAVPIVAVAVNSGRADDRLVSITSPSITSWGAYSSAAEASAANSTPGGSASSPQPVDLPALSRVPFGTGLSNKVLAVTGIKAPLYPGSSISLTFTFAKAGTVTAQVPVQLSKSPQTSVIPGPSATGEEG